MKKSLGFIFGLLTLPLLSLSQAGEGTFPQKDAILKFTVPENWASELDKDDGQLTLTTKDDRVAVNFTPIAVEATLEVFEKILPDAIKAVKGAVLEEKPKAHTEDGLSGFIASYKCELEGKPAMLMVSLFKGDKDHSVFATIIVSEPQTVPEAELTELQTFMKSLKPAGK